MIQPPDEHAVALELLAEACGYWCCATANAGGWYITLRPTDSVPDFTVESRHAMHVKIAAEAQRRRHLDFVSVVFA